MAAREAYSCSGSAGPCLGPADESSSARLSRALRGTAVEGAVPPQMGPYAAPSAGHPRDDRVDLQRPQLGRQLGQHSLLVTTVGGAKGVVAHEADARESARDLLLEDREDLVAPEEIVPELADGLAFERGQAWRDVARLHRPGPARPHHPVDLASVRSGHSVRLPVMVAGEDSIAGRGTPISSSTPCFSRSSEKFQCWEPVGNAGAHARRPSSKGGPLGPRRARSRLTAGAPSAWRNRR